MENYRIFVEKYPEFQVEAGSLKTELNENLQLSLDSLRLLNVYDLFGFTPELLEKSRYRVFGETVTDMVTDECSLEGSKYIAVEYLPGQFDQRAASAVDCVRLIAPEADVRIKSSRLLVLDGSVSDEDVAKIRHYVINAVESREKDLAKLSDTEHAAVKPVPVLEGLTALKEEELAPYCREMGLAMNADDLREVVSYFQKEGRDPSETELRILDTYWSDHCRHTTFTTVLQDVQVEESFIKGDIDDTYSLYLRIRKELGREGKDICLMDLATVGARYLKAKGMLDDMEVSEENNACSIYVDVDVTDEGQETRTERWLLQFKNETHNHPTEIEPFGGAATCLGGAIRDPLSGRSYVYQAMRLTGAGDLWREVKDTRPGKLPQKVISRKAAHGYSSYGNQIGLATTNVHEMLHPGYEAKRLEIGAVVGAVKAESVRRESPAAGDVILLLGGRTGRDGIGGATGSSKEHTEASLETCGSEVQKGNAPEERKLQRPFRRPEVTR
ncbi:MAG: phosphoribosylformylglycinamidine synthase, partial [Bacteroidales bacterium]|nr:phosphoribosylformylglycinamidine synthase [Bacteroidales bacterium]